MTAPTNRQVATVIGRLSLLIIASSLVSSSSVPANQQIGSTVAPSSLKPSVEGAASERGEKWSHDEDHSEYVNFLDFTNSSAADMYNNREEFKNLAEKEWQLMFRSFDIMYESVSSSFFSEFGHMDIMQDIEQQLPHDCRQSLAFVRQSLKKHKLWALRMIDSMGKIQSGITYGKFSSPGDYEECINVKVDEQWLNPEIVLSSEARSKQQAQSRQNWRGKYCLLDFRLPLPDRPKNKLLSVHEPVLNLSNTELAKQFPIVANYSAYASVFYEIGYLHGICIPSTCQIEDVSKAVGKALEGMYIVVNSTIDCEVLRDTTDVRPSQWLAMFLFFALFLNATIASILNFVYRKHKKERELSSSKLWSKESTVMGSLYRADGFMVKLAKRHHKYSECFSLQTNFQRLTKPDPRSLTFVHYTRIVAMALTVITHTGGLGTLQAITKPADAANSEQIFRDFIPQMLANAFTSIQIFFFMAGFMLVLSTYPSVKREKGSVSFVEYAIKRAIRLMPGLAATIGVNFIWPLMVDGPMLSYFIRLIVLPCESNWWHTLLFMSNFDHVEKMCLRHSYFSASDYQLHIIAFPVLLLLYHKPAASLLVAGLLTISGFVAQVIMISTKTALPFMMVDYLDKEAFFNVVHYIHHPVWNHISAFFAGFIIGYFVIKQYRWNISETTIKCLWYVIVPAGLGSIYAPYYWNHYKRPITKWQMVMYVIFDRAVLLIFCAWLSYASMVLSRKRPSTANGQNKQAKQATAAAANSNSQQQSNLPATVSMIDLSGSKLDQSDKKQPIKDDTELSVSAARLKSTNPQQQQVSSSTPNLAEPSQTDQTTNKTDSQKSQHRAEPAPNSRPARPITSTLNTMCLVLSRLTFQLYLFNMVVLWFDVNHSKYQWYFSYYFIIVKAFAVYTASAIFATVFFVTLESPCLTLYIMWVKYTAQKRGEKEQLRREVKQDLYEANKTMRSSFDMQANSKQPTNAPMAPPSIKVEPQLIGAAPGDLAYQAKQTRQGLFSGIYHINSSNSIHSMAVTPIIAHEKRTDASRDITRV